MITIKYINMLQQNLISFVSVTMQTCLAEYMCEVCVNTEESIVQVSCQYYYHGLDTLVLQTLENKGWSKFS